MDDNQGRHQKDDAIKEKKRRWILIPLHILVVIGIAFLIGALVRAQHQITQITMIPTPGAVESVPQESLPLANATPSPTLTASGGTATSTSTVSPTATPTATPTPSPTVTATPRPSPSTSTSPSASTSTSPSQTVEPTPGVTYRVWTDEDAPTPVGCILVFVSVSPEGSYTVTYDGQVMKYNSNKNIYYLTVRILDDDGYRSHVHVSQN